jgi:hypothetical protein
MEVSLWKFVNSLSLSLIVSVTIIDRTVSMWFCRSGDKTSKKRFFKWAHLGAHDVMLLRCAVSHINSLVEA